MADPKNELEKRDILRMSNEESNKLTRECLCTALVYLMNEKPFDKITITELVRRSGVSRSAFYRNYTSKEDIITEVTNGVISVITSSLEEIKETGNLHNWFYRLFQFVCENTAIFELLLNANILKTSSNGQIFSLESVFPASNIKEHYRIIAIENALYSVVISWFRDGMKESPAFMADLCMNLLIQQ